MSSMIYPIVSGWVWGDGWLSKIGFHDHGGSGVVHLTAGLAGGIGTYILGPRIGFFQNRNVRKGSFEYAHAQLE